jgi:hypothetical protein
MRIPWSADDQSFKNRVLYDRKEAAGDVLQEDSHRHAYAKEACRCQEEPRSLLVATCDPLGRTLSRPQYSPRQQMLGRVEVSMSFSLALGDPVVE